MFNSNQDKDKILTQFEKVRQTGEVNMMNASGVQKVAYENEYYALVRHMGSNPSGRGREHYLELLNEYEEWMND